MPRRWRVLLVLALLGLGRASASQAQPAEDPGATPNTSPSVEVAGNRSEDNPSRSEDAGSENLEVEEAAKVATLVFTTDAPCSLTVGGVSKGFLEPDQPLEVEVESLVIQVSATATDVRFALWSEDLQLTLDEIRVIAIPMLEAIEAQRKKERREQTFRDLDRSLMWVRRDNARDISWARAGGYCEDLTLGGFDNWQLPSLAELETLEAMWSIRALKVADQVQLTACCLWSTTEGPEGGVFNLDFRFRRGFEVNRKLSFGLRALCRRNMPAEELAEAQLAADPKERKRRLKEKRRRMDEKKRRRASKISQPKASPEGSPEVSDNQP